MKKLLKIIFVLFSLFAIPYSLFPPQALAVCPVCTVAVVGGLGLSRWLGIDDSISGIWAGGLMVSLTFWATDWFEKKYKFKSKFKYLPVLIFVLMVSLIFLPLAWTNVIGHPLNRLWGIDKLILGTVIGSISFLFGIWADKKERQIKSRQLFSFQKVAFPVFGLIIASVSFYFLTKR